MSAERGPSCDDVTVTMCSFGFAPTAAVNGMPESSQSLTAAANAAAWTIAVSAVSMPTVVVRPMASTMRLVRSVAAPAANVNVTVDAAALPPSATATA